MAKHQIPLRITIEVDDTPPPAAGPQITVREVDGGVVLDVPREVRAQLIKFGWQEPLEIEVGD